MIYQDYLDSHELGRYASAMNGRARQYHSTGHLTVDLLRDRIFESGGRCAWCACDLVNQDFELDHLISLKRKGSNLPDNIIVSCPSCNRRKSTKHEARFAAEIYRETGILTPCIQQILEVYGIDLTTQKSLFDQESPSSKEQNLRNDEDASSIPPYIW